ASFIGWKHSVGVANGLDALIITLKAWILLGKIKEGDEVIVTANTFIATVLAITQNHLKPIFVEPDEETFNINVDMIRNVITEKTKVIIPVHLYGQVAEMNKIRELADLHDLLILEDSAQAHGAMYNN
ncbi:DegT/DnrJ/EryC1/StrS family aminotransferase, partial [Escherichia coli]|uniref:DegT/DnrJ/EryC1/StrS family aminotransferase n=1 Tax=Escherichia coli TaxID=562 RepID=UPI001365CE19